MIKKILTLCCGLSSASVFCLQIEPWFSEAWLFELESNYTFSRYHRVQNAVRQLKSASNDHLLAWDLSVTPLFSALSQDNWNCELEVELAATPRQSFGFRSAAAQIRYRWLDDIVGDFATITTGMNLRGVSHVSLRDVSCPYHSYANIELNAAIGKEWSHWQFWTSRVFGFCGIGTASRGYPWIRALFCAQGNYNQRFQYEGRIEGYFGTGGQNTVNIDHFRGYGKIQHRSIDLGWGFRYLFDIWGSLELDYTFRIYAHCFPEYVNFFKISYRLPFSLF